MPKDASVSLELDGFEVTISNPDKVYFPDGRHHQARPGEVLHGGGRWRPARRARPADGAEALRGRHRRRGLLPEARAEVGAGVRAHRGAGLPVGPHRRRGGGLQPRRAGLGRQPRLHRPQPAPGARRRPRPPRRAAGRPRSRARRAVGRCPARGAGRRATSWPITAWSAGRRPPARAASTSMRGSSRAGASPRSGARRWPWPARSSGARRSISTSKWWKEERHGVFIDYNQNAKDRTVASAYSVRPVPIAARLGAAHLGRGARRGARRLHAAHHAGPLRQARRRGRGIDDAVGSLEALLELSARDEAAGQGDAPWPPNYAKQPGEPPRVQPSKRRMPWPRGGRPDGRARRRSAAADAAGSRAPGRRYRGAHRPAPFDPAADRDQPGQGQGRCARRPGALEEAPSEGGQAHRRGRRAGRRHARPLVAVVSGPGEPAPCPGEGPAGRGEARPRLRPVAGMGRPAVGHRTARRSPTLEGRGPAPTIWRGAQSQRRALDSVALPASGNQATCNAEPSSSQVPATTPPRTTTGEIQPAWRLTAPDGREPRSAGRRCPGQGPTGRSREAAAALWSASPPPARQGPRVRT